MTISKLVAVAVILYASCFGVAFAQDDPDRILNALNIKEYLTSRSSDTSKACIERKWPAAHKHIVLVLKELFSPTELNSLANFFESPGGKKWNAVSAAKTKNLDPRYPLVPIPEYSPEEKGAVDDFLRSPLGQNFLSGPEGIKLGQAFLRTGWGLGGDCPEK